MGLLMIRILHDPIMAYTCRTTLRAFGIQGRAGFLSSAVPHFGQQYLRDFGNILGIIETTTERGNQALSGPVSIPQHIWCPMTH